MTNERKNKLQNMAQTILNRASNEICEITANIKAIQNLQKATKQKENDALKNYNDFLESLVIKYNTQGFFAERKAEKEATPEERQHIDSLLNKCCVISKDEAEARARAIKTYCEQLRKVCIKYNLYITRFIAFNSKDMRDINILKDLFDNQYKDGKYINNSPFKYSLYKDTCGGFWLMNKITFSTSHPVWCCDSLSNFEKLPYDENMISDYENQLADVPQLLRKKYIENRTTYSAWNKDCCFTIRPYKETIKKHIKQIKIENDFEKKIELLQNKKSELIHAVWND